MLARRVLVAVVAALAVAAAGVRADSLEVEAVPPPPEGAQAGNKALSPCQSCVYTVEKIKKGVIPLLPSICTAMFKEFGQEAYASCHETLNGLEMNGNSVKFWLFEGCYKYEVYQSKEWIKPCPTHVICSVIQDLQGKPFCKALPMENPFAEAAAPP